MGAKSMVVLFDESGTPAISNDQRTDWFLGVGVAYEQSDEEVIFSKCESDFPVLSQREQGFPMWSLLPVSVVKLSELWRHQ